MGFLACVSNIWYYRAKFVARCYEFAARALAVQLYMQPHLLQACRSGPSSIATFLFPNPGVPRRYASHVTSYLPQSKHLEVCRSDPPSTLMNVFSLSVILFFVVVWGQHAGCRLLGLLRSALERLYLRACALDGSRSLVPHRGRGLAPPHPLSEQWCSHSRDGCIQAGTEVDRRTTLKGGRGALGKPAWRGPLRSP